MATSKRNSQSNPIGTDIKVVASKSCPSLSGKCTISYKLGLDPEGKLFRRLHENSGGGFFNNDWVYAQALVDALLAVKGSKTLTSMALAPLFRGRSANTPSFLTAVLRHEGALLPYKKTSRLHVIGDLDGFLKCGDAAAQVNSRPPRKKAASKKTRSKPKASPVK